MSTTNIYGTVNNYQTGEIVRRATREDWLRARRDGDPHTGAHRTAEFGDVTVYIDGGPDEDPEDVAEDEDDGPICPRCGHSGFTSLRLLSDEDLVRREVQCNRCSRAGILVASREEDEASDLPVGEWEPEDEVAEDDENHPDGAYCRCRECRNQHNDY